MLFWGIRLARREVVERTILFRKTRIIEIICNLHGIKRFRDEDFSKDFFFIFRSLNKSKNDKCNLITIQIRSITEKENLFSSSDNHWTNCEKCVCVCVCEWMFLCANTNRVILIFASLLFSFSFCYTTFAFDLPARFGIQLGQNKLDFWLKTYFICRILIVNSNSISRWDWK